MRCRKTMTTLFRDCWYCDAELGYLDHGNMCPRCHSILSRKPPNCKKSNDDWIRGKVCEPCDRCVVEKKDLALGQLDLMAYGVSVIHKTVDAQGNEKTERVKPSDVVFDHVTQEWIVKV
jgi:hypothetical protein